MSYELAAGVFPNIWEKVEVGKLGQWITGSTPSSKKKDVFGGEYPFVTPGDIHEWGKLGHVTRRLTDTGIDEVRVVNPPSVLLVCIGTIGKVAWTDIEVATNQQINALSVDTSKFDPRFLSLLFSSSNFQEMLWENSSSTIVSIINKGTLSKLVVAIPPKSEQEKIVEILEVQLSRLDAALSSVRSVRVKAAQFSKSLLHAAFAGVLTGKDISAGQIPEGWQQSTLGELVSISNRAGLPAENPILPFVGMEHIESETGKLLSYGDPADYRSSSYIVDSKQVLYGRLRPYLNKVFIPKEESYASREFIPMNLNEDLNQQFLLYRLRSSEFVEFAISLNTGDRPRVKWPQMAEYPICLPPIVEQEKIIEILEEHFSRLNASLAIADGIERKSSAMRRSLLHAAFTGELTKEWREGAHV